jgi:hypothetical protein
MIEAVHISESVNIYFTTWQYTPEDSKLHTGTTLILLPSVSASKTPQSSAKKKESYIMANTLHTIHAYVYFWM